jgi:putative ABC transport system permease protein
MMLKRLLASVRSRRSSRTRASDLDDEIAFHLSEEAEERQGDGLPAHAARDAARRDFGNVTLVREATREAWGWGPVERLLQDVRYAIRALAAARGVSAVAILLLTLAIGANSAIFSIVSSLLLRPLPVRTPEQLVLLTDSIGRRTSWTNPIWEQLRERRAAFDGAFAWSGARLNLAPAGEADYVDGLWTSGGLFEVLGIEAALGRTLSERDDRRGLGPDGAVAVISHAFWQRRFAGSPTVIGRTLTIERVPFTIIGVTPPSFFGTEVGRAFDVAIPIAAKPLVERDENALERRASWWLRIMFRLKPGQTLEAAQAQLAATLPAIKEATEPSGWPKGRYLRDGLALTAAAQGASTLRQTYRHPLMVVMVVAGLVLLIACGNLANLLLARAAARRAEMSLRVALGASRLRLGRQLVLESALLAAAGVVGGLALASVGGPLLVSALSTVEETVHLDAGLDWRSLMFTAGIGALTVVMFGAAPAFRATRVPPAEALRTLGRTGTSLAYGRFGHALVVGQVALSLVLLVGAGLFLRTFSTLRHRDLGFTASPVLVTQVVAGSDLDSAAHAAWAARVLEAARTVPGVTAAGLSVLTPMGGSSWNNRVEVVGLPPSEDAPLTYFNQITPDWLRTYDTRLVAGRDFTAADRDGAPPVALVNETFVRQIAGGRNPIGLDVREPGNAAARRVVGYVRDAAYDSLRDPPPPTLYMPFAQQGEGPRELILSVRTDGSPAAIVRPLAKALQGVDPGASLTFRRLADQVDAALTQERLLALLSGAFGLLAVLLAGVGLYGITAHAVTQRRSEIAIRLALGAPASRVVVRMLARIGGLIGAGVAIGVALSVWAAPLVATLLVDVSPRDAATIAGATLLLAAVGGFAGWNPARRIARIDPARVLREG